MSSCVRGELLEGHRDGEVTLIIQLEVLGHHLIVLQVRVSLFVRIPHFGGDMFERLPHTILDHFLLRLFKLLELADQIVKQVHQELRPVALQRRPSLIHFLRDVADAENELQHVAELDLCTSHPR